MSKARKLADTMCQEYSSSPAADPLIKVLNCGDAEVKNNQFFAKQSGRFLQLKASCPLMTSTACSFLIKAKQSGFIAEYLGSYHSPYSSRILWVGSHHSYKISDRLEVAVPSFFEEIEKGTVKVEQIVRRLVDWGCNKLMIGISPTIPLHAELAQCDLSSIIRQFKDYGIGIIVKPQFKSDQPFSPFDSQSIEQLKNELGEWISREGESLDGLFWESQWSEELFANDSYVQDKTYYEWFLAEIKLLEKIVDRRFSLIYSIPVYSDEQAHLQAPCLQQMVDDVSEKTIVAFSAVAGPPHQDHLSAHPFWEELRRSPDSSATPLLPIVNSGGLDQGEGLWPGSAFDLVDRFYSRMQRHPFAGAIHMVNRLPAEGSLLDMNLWVAGQALLRGGHSHLHAESWLAVYYPHLNASLEITLMSFMRHIILELSLIKKGDVYSPDVFRVKGEKILVQLKELVLLVSQIKKGEQRNLLVDSVPYFVRDIKRILLHQLEKLHVPIAHVLSGEESKDSFWSIAKSGLSKGMSSGASNFFKEPYCSKEDPVMIRLFQENRLF